MSTRIQGLDRATPPRSPSPSTSRRRPRPGREARPECLPFERLVSPEPESRRWRINGWPVVVLVWTDAEVRRLREPPPDAQHYREVGVWIALRLTD